MNVGDIVQLKSGGQVMTVERAEEGKKVVCVWMSNGKLMREQFEKTVLETQKPFDTHAEMPAYE